MKAYLQRVNPENQSVWFYSIQIQQDLLGHWQVVRNWGSFGAGGTMKQTPFDTMDKALTFMERLRNELVRKGYKVVMQEGFSAHRANPSS
ncbi:MAG: WGR domain-containing protein [Magnetococcales bacterium]|nr:WGR domain-containing protein [Magnetococcales bacterium]